MFSQMPLHAWPLEGADKQKNKPTLADCLSFPTEGVSVVSGTPRSLACAVIIASNKNTSDHFLGFLK